jgi:hypothetical protein
MSFLSNVLNHRKKSWCLAAALCLLLAVSTTGVQAAPRGGESFAPLAA